LVPVRGAFTSVRDLEEAIHAYIAETNSEPKPFVSAKSADDILGSVASFRQRNSNLGHQANATPDGLRSGRLRPLLSPA
jgi:hypothetical protein